MPKCSQANINVSRKTIKLLLCIFLVTALFCCAGRQEFKKATIPEAKMVAFLADICLSPALVALVRRQGEGAAH